MFSCSLLFTVTSVPPVCNRSGSFSQVINCHVPQPEVTRHVQTSTFGINIVYETFATALLKAFLPFDLLTRLARNHPLYAFILHSPIECWILSLTTIINSWYHACRNFAVCKFCGCLKLQQNLVHKICLFVTITVVTRVTFATNDLNSQQAVKAKLL